MNEFQSRAWRAWGEMFGAAAVAQPNASQHVVIVRFRGLPPEEEVVRYVRGRLTNVRDVGSSPCQLEVVVRREADPCLIGADRSTHLRLRLRTAFALVEASERGADSMQALPAAFDVLEHELALSALRRTWAWSVVRGSGHS